MKVILPVAGTGSRLRPFTLTRPKCLLSIAGKTLLEHINESFASLQVSERVLIAGYLAENIQDFITEKKWENTHIVLQNNPQGLGEAIYLCREFLKDDEPVLIILGDTLFDADLSFVKESETNILWTRTVDDPRRFGVVECDDSGFVKRLVEKPQEFVSNEALVGIYYIKDVKALRSALQELIQNNERTNGEFQLTDALEKMLRAGSVFKTASLNYWFDCGTPATLLETNELILNKTNVEREFPNTTIIPPCYFGQNVTIENSRIGPGVTIGDNVIIKNATLSETIVGDDSQIENASLKKSVLGENVVLKNYNGSAFLGDYSSGN